MSEQARAGAKATGRGVSVAALLGVAGLLGVLGVAVWVMYAMQEGGFSLSAIQVTQLYTQAAFWVLVAIGVMLAALLWSLETRD